MTINQIVNHENREPVVVPEEEWNYYACEAHGVYYQAQCTYATIHVLHHLMVVSTITLSLDCNQSLHVWAELYDNNILLKYIEVVAILYPSNLPETELTAANAKFLTGENGMGSRYPRNYGNNEGNSLDTISH